MTRCFLLGLIACIAAPALAEPPAVKPVVKKGIMDLRHWDFQTAPPLSLDGQWQFYWHQFPDPGSLPAPGLSPIFAKVPGSWNNVKIGGNKIGGHGYATYHARILLGENPGPLALKLRDAATAFTLFVNGRLAAESGVPGTSPDTARPFYRPQVVVVENPPPLLDLTFRVSNFHHWQGGMWEPVLLGRADDIQALRERRLLTMICLFSCILIMGLYHLVLYRFRPNDPSTLFFGIGCLLLAFRILGTGERYISDLMPSLAWHWQMKGVYLSYYVSLPVFYLYAKSIFPKDIARTMLGLTIVMATVCSLVVLAAPARIFSLTMPVYQAFTVCMLFYAIYVTIRINRFRRQGAPIFTAGILVFSAATIHDILLSRGMISGGQLVPVGLLLFIFSQAVLISQKFSRTFTLVEQQHEALKTANQAYEKTQSALEASEKQFRSLIERSADGICIVQDDVIRYFNTSFLKFTGEKKQTLTGKPFLELINPEDQQAMARYYRDLLAGKQIKGRYGLKVFNRHGEARDVEVNTSRVRWEDAPAVMAIIRDYTEQKKTQALLIQTEKMLSLGGLAAGMAHEINNPLSGMMQNAQVAINRLSKDLPANISAAESCGITMDTVRDYARQRNILHSLDAIRSSGSSAAKIVANMLNFAQKHPTENQPRDLGRIMEKALDLACNDYNLKRQYDFKQIRIRTAVDPDLPQVPCQESQIQQVLFNLLKNAAQELHREPRQGADPEISIRISQDKDMAAIRLTDNGPGMDTGTRLRCFEPFFTTKAVDQGTGLGLSVAYFIITETHHGRMMVESEPGRGTTFVIFLPIQNHDYRREEALLCKSMIPAKVKNTWK